MSDHIIFFHLNTHVKFERVRRKLSMGCQNGHALFELAFLLLFLAAIMMAMVTIAVFSSKNFSSLEEIRYEMRLSMHTNAAGNFRYNHKEDDVVVVVPGKIKNLFGTPVLHKNNKIEFYEGSYHNLGNNFYNNQYLVRNIMDQLR